MRYAGNRVPSAARGAKSAGRSSPRARCAPTSLTAHRRGSPATTTWWPRRATASRSPPTHRFTPSPTAYSLPSAPRPGKRPGFTSRPADGDLSPRYQIGRYETTVLATQPVPVDLWRRLPCVPRRGASARVEMLAAFTDMFGPLPVPRYTAVVTDDRWRFHWRPRRASPRSAPTTATPPATRNGSSRTVNPPVVRQLGHAQAVARYLAARGFACYAEWLWASAATTSRRISGRTTTTTS